MPVTKAMIEEEKARNMAIAARPIKKVLSLSLALPPNLPLSLSCSLSLFPSLSLPLGARLCREPSMSTYQKSVNPVEAGVSRGCAVREKTALLLPVPQHLASTFRGALSILHGWASRRRAKTSCLDFLHGIIPMGDPRSNGPRARSLCSLSSACGKYKRPDSGLSFKANVFKMF